MVIIFGAKRPLTLLSKLNYYFAISKRVIGQLISISFLLLYLFTKKTNTLLTLVLLRINLCTAHANGVNVNDLKYF